MAKQLDAREVKALKEKIRELEAEFQMLPSWTDRNQSAGEILLHYKAQLREHEEAEADITVTPPPLEYRRGDVEDELRAIDKRLQLLGDGELTEPYVAHRQLLQARKDLIGQRLPFHGVSDDDLAQQLEDAEVEVERLTTRQTQLPRLRPNDPLNSNEALQVARLHSEASENIARLRTEQRLRLEHKQAQIGVEAMAKRQAEELAARTWRNSIKAQQDQMVANGEPRWKLQQLTEESGGAPPEELVEQFAADIKADFIAEHPSLDTAI